ncbi:MAG: OmpA family protein [Verrucomicrobiota bacterium]|nr:OmpA family protein [Verrucomicrobiota bacterium]
MNIKNLVLLGLISLVAGCASDMKKDDGSAGGNAGWESSTGSDLPDPNALGIKGDFDPERDLDFDTLRSDTVYYDYDRATVKASERPKLEAVAIYLKANPKATLYVVGHCDVRGTMEYNRTLGEKRANSARDFLMGQGINGNRIGTLSYGSEKPAVQGDGEDAYAKNRRSEFGLVKK